MFKFITNRNINKLSTDEKEAAAHLKNILDGLISNADDKMSIALYFLAFKRSNKQIVPIDDLLDPIKVLTTPKLIHYLGIFSAIKEIVGTTIKQFKSPYTSCSLTDCEASILVILQQAANRIDNI